MRSFKNQIILLSGLYLFNLATFAGLFQINVDDFNISDMEQALKTHGTIELVGPSIIKLSQYANRALETAKEILLLPEETLDKVSQQNFHGFQNVKKESALKGQVRNQIAFHFKPYREDNKMPQNISDENFRAYYDQGMIVLHGLYNLISDTFQNSHKSELGNDNQSVLTSRKYFTSHIEGATGIPPHSDYGLLTLVTSDEPGLEVKEGNEWIKAPSSPGLRFYVNIGDWFLFQLGKKEFTAGIHRVPEVEKERHSLALFLNPKYDEQLKTPSGKIATYKDFLFSDKRPYLAE